MTPPLPEPHRFTCASCGVGWDEASAFCPRCGAAQSEQTHRKTSPAKVVYGCCALFFGALGLGFFPPLLPAADSHQTFTLAVLWAFATGILTLFFIWKLFRGGN